MGQEVRDPDAITSLEAWIQEMQELVDAVPNPRNQMLGALEVTDRLLRGREALDLSQFGPGKRSYARHRIHRDPADRFCLLILVWRPGQGTPIHDHSGTWGVYGVLQNRMRFVDYAVEKTADGERLVVTSNTIANAGSSTTVIPPHCDIHRMENPHPKELSITAHCYGKEVLDFNIFTPESGARRPGSVSYDTEK